MASSTWFGELASRGGAEVPSWLDALHKAGAEQFERVGFPSGREEEWRFTQLAPITRARFRPAPREADRTAAESLARQFTFGPADASAELVFVNGHFEPQLSRFGRPPRGARVASLTEAAGSEAQPRIRQHLGQLARVDAGPFVALNTGALRDGAFVHVPRGAAPADGRPIHLLFLTTMAAAAGAGNVAPAVAHPRVLVLVDEGAQATIVETYAGAPGGGAYFTNAVTEIIAGADARIDHCKLQQESAAAYHVATMQVQLARGSDFVSHSASLGGRITRNDLNVTMAGPHAQATLNGLVLIEGEQHVDNHTLLDHASPDCPSHEIYKYVLGGRASGVFKGKILVRPDAQKTDAKQASKALLLSDDAVMNAQPALEIYADDVKCTHGSTTGPVDEEQVFYLRSRGVSAEAARHLLSYAFAADITRRIRVEPVRRRLESFMAAQHGLPQDLRITDLGAHDEAARNL